MDLEGIFGSRDVWSMRPRSGRPNTSHCFLSRFSREDTILRRGRSVQLPNVFFFDCCLRIWNGFLMRTGWQANETRLSPRRYDTLNPPSCFASRGKVIHITQHASRVIYSRPQVHRIAPPSALAFRAHSSSLLLLHGRSRSEQNSLIVDTPTVTDT